MGIETMVSVWPQVDWRSENYEEMKQKGLLVKSNTGIDILVAPIVYEKAMEREVYLPVFLWDGKQSYLVGEV